MPAAHRAVGDRLIRRSDLPHLFAFAVHALSYPVAVGFAKWVLDIPTVKGALFVGVCYVSFFGGRRLRRLLLKLLTPTPTESREDAEKTIRATTTIGMEWKRAPVSLPAEPPVSDRGVDEHDALAEHPHPRYTTLRRNNGGTRRAPARV